MHWTPLEAHSGRSAARFGHTAVALENDACTVVVYGGVSARADIGDHTALGDVAVFEAKTRQWSTPNIHGDGPGPRAFHTACCVGTSMYIFGGHVLSFDMEQNKKKRNFFDDVWCLDYESLSWSKVELASQSCPPRRDMAAMVHAGDGQLLLYGGRSDAGRTLNDLWSFDTAAQQWTQIKPAGPSPPPRKMHALAMAGGRLVLLGGERDAGVLDDLWLLDGCAGGGRPHRWTQIRVKPTPSARFGHAMALAHHRLALYGGCLEQSSFFAVSRSYVQTRELWLLDMNSFSWARVELQVQQQQQQQQQQLAGPQERMCHTLTALPDGTILLLGGRKREGICEDAWLLDVEGHLPAAAHAAATGVAAVEPAAAAAAVSESAAAAASTLAAAAGEQMAAAAGALVAAATGTAAAGAVGAQARPPASSLFSSLLSFKKLDATAPAAAAAAAAPAAGGAAGGRETPQEALLPFSGTAAAAGAAANSVDISAVAASVPKSGSLLGVEGGLFSLFNRTSTTDDSTSQQQAAALPSPPPFILPTTTPPPPQQQHQQQLPHDLILLPSQSADSAGGGGGSSSASGPATPSSTGSWKAKLMKPMTSSSAVQKLSNKVSSFVDKVNEERWGFNQRLAAMRPLARLGHDGRRSASPASQSSRPASPSPHSPRRGSHVHCPSFDDSAAMAVAAAADAAAMERLRVERLHLPALPASQQQQVQQQTATQGLIKLGRELGRSNGSKAGVDQLMSAARQHLLDSDPTALPLKQVELLLADYKQLARAQAAVMVRRKLQQFQQQQQQQQQREGGLLGVAAGVQLRFVNACGDSLRMGDVAALHCEYCRLLGGAQA